MSQTTGNKSAAILGSTLDQATEKLLANGKSPSRKVGGLDNRGSHFYLALYWAEALSNQSENETLKNEFSALYQQLLTAEDKIVSELLAVQGHPVNLGGYYHPNSVKVSELIRPSSTFNSILKNF